MIDLDIEANNLVVDVEALSPTLIVDVEESSPIAVIEIIEFVLGFPGTGPAGVTPTYYILGF
jgi:hypothetical protein